MTDLKIAAAYIRVSTDDQVELSPASQLVEIRKWGAANGYLVPDEFVFVDEAKSGRKVTGRDEFRRLIATAKAKPKPFDAILLWKFSRFARNRDDAVYYKSILRKQLKIEVISIKEPIEDGKMGVIMESMIEAMDEYYSINLAEDVKRGMEEKHRRGELQATPSFGYTVLDNVLVPVPEEAVYVQEIFSRFVSGEGFYSIARWLNSMGVKTHRGCAFENRTVEYILRNPVYIGKLRWNPAGRSRRDYADPNIIVTDGRHEPLVSEDTFQQSQTRIAQLKATTPYKARPLGSNKDWISGLVRCASCGSTLIFAKPHYWKCNNYVRGRCRSSQHISSDVLKKAILDRLHMDAAASAPLSYDVLRVNGRDGDTTAALRTQRASLERRLERLREAFLAGVDTVEEYRQLKEDAQAQIQRIDQELSAAAAENRRAGDVSIMRSAISDALAVIENEDASLEQRCNAARSIIGRITWDKAQNLLTIHYRLMLE